MRQTLLQRCWIVLCTLAMLGSCGPTMHPSATGGTPERDDRFTFTPLTDDTASAGTSRMPIAMLQRTLQIPYRARFRGSLLALFGAPLTSSTDAESAFSYVLSVQNDRGERWIMTAYEGPTGPAFGGFMPATTDEPIRGAEALLALIESTPPADFDAVLEADDYDSRIFYGCRAGACYWREEPQ